MTSLLSVYWSALHGQAEGLEYIRRLQPRDVLILDPDVQHVIDAHEASPESEITLRRWEWDDGRTRDNQHGVYKRIADDPEGAADWVIANYMSMVTAMEAEARRRGRRFPAREQLTLHLVNEPDSNYILPALNRHTIRACQQARAHGVKLDGLNLSTGHPAILNANGEPDWSPLYGALEALAAAGHYAVTHEYTNSLGIQNTVPWHIGRHTKWAPRIPGLKWKIGEFGVEELVNGHMDDHHGWQGRISPDQMVAETDWYLGQTRDDVKAVRIFMTGYADRVWRTFDTEPIRDRLVAVGQRYPSEREPSQTHTVHIPVVIAPPDPTSPEPTALPPVTQPPADNFQRALAFVLRWEGGWADNPNDPGGATMQGITLATFTRWRQAQGMPTPTKDDLRAIKPDERDAIYYQWYWLASKAHEMAWPLCLAQFDTAVNAGVYRAQEMHDASGGDFLRYMGVLIDWYTRINGWEHFGRGWMRRRAALLAEAAN